MKLKWVPPKHHAGGVGSKSQGGADDFLLQKIFLLRLLQARAGNGLGRVLQRTQTNIHPAEGQPVTNPLLLFRVDLLPFVRGLPAKFATLKLLTHSRASVASVMAASFAERIKSAAGIISTVGNTALGFTEIGHLVTCRMNTKFVVEMSTGEMSDRYNHPEHPIDLVGQ